MKRFDCNYFNKTILSLIEKNKRIDEFQVTLFTQNGDGIY